MNNPDNGKDLPSSTHRIFGKESIDGTFHSRMINALSQENAQGVYDVSFIVGCQKFEIGAHRQILQIQSPEFCKILKNNPDTHKITITDDVTPEEFRMFLQFLYTGIATDDVTYTLPLLQLAEKYDIPDLRYTCNFLLKNVLDPSCVVQVYEQACKYGRLDLQQRFLDFIGRNGIRILDSTEFLYFTKYNLCKVIAMDQLQTTDETQVFKAVLRWGKKQCDQKGMEPTGANLRLELQDLIPIIRFPLMLKSDFSRQVVPTGILNEKEITSMFFYYKATESNKNAIAPGIFSDAPRKTLMEQLPLSIPTPTPPTPQPDKNYVHYFEMIMAGSKSTVAVTAALVLTTLGARLVYEIIRS